MLNIKRLASQKFPFCLIPKTCTHFLFCPSHFIWHLCVFPISLQLVQSPSLLTSFISLKNKHLYMYSVNQSFVTFSRKNSYSILVSPYKYFLSANTSLLHVHTFFIAWHFNMYNIVGFFGCLLYFPGIQCYLLVHLQKHLSFRFAMYSLSYVSPFFYILHCWSIKKISRYCY